MFKLDLLNDSLILILEHLETFINLLHRLAAVSALLDQDHLLLQIHLEHSEIHVGLTKVHLGSLAFGASLELEFEVH